MVDFVKLLGESGSFTVSLVGILIYWQLMRERRLSDRLDKVQDDHTVVMRELVQRNNLALKDVAVALENLTKNCEKERVKRE
jgi:hypothetical protein